MAEPCIHFSAPTFARLCVPSRDGLHSFCRRLQTGLTGQTKKHELWLIQRRELPTSLQGSNSDLDKRSDPAIDLSEITEPSTLKWVQLG